ncbi:MAG: hypothetical protein K9I71_12700 [Ignavibacteriales bacterium]|nr:hypothetical protein [Ignavibacteriales bacterium]MCF8438549.1 hypothetical protein [Ignavibacteriales bacterium]
MSKTKVEFKKLKIPTEYGVPIFDIFYVIENGRTKVMENFNALPSDLKDLVKDLLCRMATIPKFKSPKIKYNLKGYNYGEIKPKPHRFFFFQKCGDNYIFFEYLLKKEDSLSDDIYKRINEMKEKYEEEFRRFISTN